MELTYKIPAAAVSALCRVHDHVPEALVAGGCLRDTLLGRPVNDVDIFVPYGKERLAALAIEGTHPVLTKSIPEPYFTFNSDVRSVDYYAGSDGELPINIIGVSEGTCTPWQQLERFDFGICRVAFDGERLWKDLSFDRDARDRTFTLMVSQTDDQRDYSMQRYERLLKKYPTWRFVDFKKALDFGDL